MAFACAGTVAALSSRVRVQQGDPAPQPSASRGRQVYEKHCVECHGESGKGDGPAAMTLVPHPRDFTSGRYKLRSTDTGTLPTHDDEDRRNAAPTSPGT
jgi:cytochrome c oxidase cbb3-type subunit 2